MSSSQLHLMDHTYHNFPCSSKVSVDLLRKVDMNLVQITPKTNNGKSHIRKHHYMGPLHVDKTFNITVNTTNTKPGNSNQYDYILFFI